MDTRVLTRAQVFAASPEGRALLSRARVAGIPEEELTHALKEADLIGFEPQKMVEALIEVADISKLKPTYKPVAPSEDDLADFEHEIVEHALTGELEPQVLDEDEEDAQPCQCHEGCTCMVGQCDCHGQPRCLT